MDITKTRLLHPASFQKILVALREDRNGLGPKLGYAAYNARVPAKLIAQMVGTTEQTMYRWYYGCEPRRESRKRIKALTEILHFATKQQMLPMPEPTHGELANAITRAASILKSHKNPAGVAEQLSA